MKRDFLAELKRTIRRIDEPARVEIPAFIVRRYNIHERSLPHTGPGALDKIIVFNVTKNEATWWLEHRLQSFIYLEEPTELKCIIYYDIIPTDATQLEKSPYYNAGNLIKEVTL